MASRLGRGNSSGRCSSRNDWNKGPRSIDAPGVDRDKDHGHTGVGVAQTLFAWASLLVWRRCSGPKSEQRRSLPDCCRSRAKWLWRKGHSFNFTRMAPAAVACCSPSTVPYVFVLRYHFSSFFSSVWILAPGCERVCSDVQSPVGWPCISQLPQSGCQAQQASAAPSSIADAVGSHRSSNKPSEELYRNFKANFPELARPVVGSTAPAHGAPSLADALDIPLNPRYAVPAALRRPRWHGSDGWMRAPAIAATRLTSFCRPLDDHPHDMKDVDPTPRGSNEPWNFGTSGLTPSLMDPNSHSFNMLANQLPGYYTPTPGGTNTLYHHQAGDLHTPSFGMGINTPLSLPTSEGTLHAGQQTASFHGFHAHLPPHMQQPTFQNLNPFQMHQQPGYPPHHFSQQPSFDGVDGHVDESSVDDVNMDVGMQQQHHHQSPQLLFHHPVMQPMMQPPPVHPSGDKYVPSES